jgi:hypothetical protein
VLNKVSRGIRRRNVDTYFIGVKGVANSGPDERPSIAGRLRRE